MVIRGEKVTRDKTSEIQLTIPELKVSDADRIRDSTRSSGIRLLLPHIRVCIHAGILQQQRNVDGKFEHVARWAAHLPNS